MNTVILLGNITRDPELRFIASGQANASFGLAVNRRWFNKTTQQYDEQASFFNVVAWGELGENLAESITKGARVVVTGRLEQRSWETDSGEKRTVIEVVADEVAPSLRWATAVVSKTERRDSGASAPTARAPQPAPRGDGGYGFDEDAF